MAANIARYFTQHLAHPQHVLYRHYIDETWRDVTVSEVAREIARWQAAFRREGLARGDRIALCARNSIAWISAERGSEASDRRESATCRRDLQER